MIRDLPSTSTRAVSKELIRLRNEVGAMAMGRVLTLIVAVDEDIADQAVQTANDATRQHPARILGVVVGARRGKARVDAQVGIGAGASGERALSGTTCGRVARSSGGSAASAPVTAMRVIAAGAIRLSLMPWAAPAVARLRVRPMTPPLAVA